MDPQDKALGVRATEFLDFLKLSFERKRKTLFNNLRTHYSEASLRAAIEKAGVKRDARAEALPLAKAAAVFKALHY